MSTQTDKSDNCTHSCRIPQEWNIPYTQQAQKHLKQSWTTIHQYLKKRNFFKKRTILITKILGEKNEEIHWRCTPPYQNPNEVWFVTSNWLASTWNLGFFSWDCVLNLMSNIKLKGKTQGEKFSPFKLNWSGFVFLRWEGIVRINYEAMCESQCILFYKVYLIRCIGERIIYT